MSTKRKRIISNRLLLIGIIAEIGDRVEGLNALTAIIYLGQEKGLPLEYEFEVLDDGTVLSEGLFDDLLDLVEQGIFKEEFEERGEIRIPVFSAEITGREALEYLETQLGKEHTDSVKAFAHRFRSKQSEEILRKEVLRSLEASK
jgi:hypothetical protein